MKYGTKVKELKEEKCRVCRQKERAYGTNKIFLC